MADIEERQRQPPFSLRLTLEERAYLERKAGEKPLGAYIKARLFADAPQLNREVQSETRKSLAGALAALGQSRLANNLNQLAKAANSGSLPVTPDTVAAIQAAYRDVQDMKRMLMTALGIMER